MKIIYKYPLKITSEQSILLPKDSKILHVGNVGLELYIWVLHDCYTLQKNYEPYIFSIYGTGNPIHFIENNIFVGTVQMRNNMVWHIFISKK